MEMDVDYGYTSYDKKLHYTGYTVFFQIENGTMLMGQ